MGHGFNTWKTAFDRLDQQSKFDMELAARTAEIRRQKSQVDEVAQGHFAPLPAANLREHDKNNGQDSDFRRGNLSERVTTLEDEELPIPRKTLPPGSLTRRVKDITDKISESPTGRKISRFFRDLGADLRVYLTPTDRTVRTLQRQWSRAVENVTNFFAIPSVRKATIVTAIIGLIILSSFQPVAAAVIVAIIVAGIGAKYLYGKREQIKKDGEKLANSVIEGSNSLINNGRRLAGNAMRRAGEALNNAGHSAMVGWYDFSDHLEGSVKEMMNSAKEGWDGFKSTYRLRTIDSLFDELSKIEDQIKEELENENTDSNEKLDSLYKQESKIYKQLGEAKITIRENGETMRVSEVFRNYYDALDSNNYEKKEELEAQFPFLINFTGSYNRVKAMKEASDLEEAKSIANQFDRIHEKEVALMERAENHGYSFNIISILQLDEGPSIDADINELERPDLEEARSIVAERERLKMEQDAFLDRVRENGNLSEIKEVLEGGFEDEDEI